MPALVRLLGFVLFLFLASCSVDNQPEVIKMGLATAANNLDPRFATDATSSRVNRLLYDRLVDFDSEMKPVPSLATWTRIDSTHYRFQLKQPYKRFSDGSLLTSEDVMATYLSILDPETGSPNRGNLKLINTISIDGQDTINFELNRADPLFPAYLVHGILPSEKIANNYRFQDVPVGSGNFRFIRKLSNGGVALKRLSDHQLFVLHVVADPLVRVLKLRKGEIDLLQNDLPTEMVDYLQTRNFNYVQQSGSRFTYIGLNLKNGSTSHFAIRKAIAMAINRQAILDALFKSKAEIANTLLRPEHWASNSSVEGISFDPEQAKLLLSSQGYSNTHPLKLTYKTSSDPFRVRIATIIQSQLGDVGIQLKVNSYDWGTFFGDIKSGNFEMYSLSWVGIKTPDIFRYAFHSESMPPNGANRGRLNDPVIDSLIDQAEQANSLNEQAQYYQLLQSRLQKTLPYIPMWYEHQYAFYSKRLSHYQINQEGNYDGLQTVIIR